MARPTRLTDGVQAALCEAVGKGIWLAQASRLLGLHPQTTRRWARLGRQRPGSRFGAFLAAIKKAEASAAMRCVEAIQRAAEGGTWQAAAWILERRWPQRWSTNRGEIREILKKLKELERWPRPPE